MIPRIERRFVTFQIRPGPACDIGWTLDQCLQALLSAWIVADIELVEIQHSFQAFDRLARNRCACAAELPHDGRPHQPDEQTKDHNNHQQLQQREAAIMSIPLLTCMATVAAFYHLPPRVLPSIQSVEGGNIGVIHVNTDGSQDLGLMQINTRWITRLAEVARIPPDNIRTRLLYDGCFNVAAAGAIMRTYLNEAGGNLMLAIGYYHSHTPALNLAYQSKVLGSAYRLFGTSSGATPHANRAYAKN
jgi:hypothetical protein